MSTFDIYMQVIPASISGTCFILLSIYFFSVKRKHNNLHHEFAYYLFAMALFIILKPLQLLVGIEHPFFSKFICIFRYQALMLFAGPMFIIATEHLGGVSSNLKKQTIFGAGTILGVLYAFFTANSNLKQFALYISILFGLIFFVGVGVRRLQIWHRSLKARDDDGENSLYFAIGALIFGIALVFSASINLFWGLYFAALPSAIFCTYGMYQDIQRINNRYERIIPLIREELLQDINIIENSANRLQEMLELGGIKIMPNMFLLIKIDSGSDSSQQVLDLRRSCFEMANNRLSETFGVNCFLAIPVGSRYLAIALSCQTKSTDDINKFAEQLRTQLEEKNSLTITIGLGRCYPELFNLKLSYREALLASIYGERLGGNIVINIADIQVTNTDKAYPKREIENLLLAVKQGHREYAQKILPDIIDKIFSLSQQKREFYQYYLHEILFLCLNSATNAGANPIKTRKQSEEFYKKISIADNMSQLTDLTHEIVNTMISAVVTSPKTHSNNIVNKAKIYIAKHITTPLSVEAVATAVSVSPSHFRSVFKKEEGISFLQYVTKVRCDLAKKLLANSQKNISDVATELGFTDSNYFSTVFKKQVGMSPREFRKSLT